MRLQPRLIITICGVVSGLALAGCSSDSDGAPEAVSATAVGSDTAPVPGGSDAGGTGDGASGYGDLCDAKQQTGDALLDAAGDSSDAIDEGDVDAVRAAYVAYYDAYQADVDAMVELSRAISDDPTALGRGRGRRRGSDRSGRGIVRRDRRPQARSGRESADTIEEIVEAFNEFINDLRGTPIDSTPYAPPVIVSWGTEPNTACNNS